MGYKNLMLVQPGEFINHDLVVTDGNGITINIEMAAAFFFVCGVCGCVCVCV